MRIRFLLGLFLFLQCLTVASAGENEVVYQQLFSGGRGLVEFGNEFLGTDVAISDKVGVASIPPYPVDGFFRAGAVQLFERIAGTDTWEESVLLRSPEPQGAGYFGSSVAVNDRFIAVGAYGTNEFKGKVFIYEKRDGNWTVVHSIAAPHDGVQAFGRTIQMDNDTLVVGSPSQDPMAPSSIAPGEVSFYRVGTWELLDRFANPEFTSSGSMGRALSLSGDTLVAGAFNTAYVFTRDPDTSRWSYLNRITSDRPTFAHDPFGWAVATDGEFVAVGESGALSGIAGKVHLYSQDDLGAWVNTKTIQAGEDLIGGTDNFGDAIAFSGERLFVGAGRLPSSERSGQIFSYCKDSPEWTPALPIQTELEAGELGSSIAIHGDLLLGGLPKFRNRGITGAGGIEIYRIGETSNIAPLITSTPYPEASIGVPYAYDISTFDEDGDTPLAIEVVSAPDWLSLTPGAEGLAQLSGTPPAGAAGEYGIELLVRDPGGLAGSQSFTLLVFENAQAPSVTAISPDTNAFVNQSLTLSVNATGTGTTLYQWLFDGEPVPGATDARLHFDQLGLADAGSYALVLTNSAGTITSAVIELGVDADDRIGGDWATFGRRPDHTGHYPATLRDHRFVPAWTTEILPGAALTPTSTGDGKIFVTTRPGPSDRNQSAFALDQKAGTIVWQKTFDSADSVDAPSYYDGRVYVQVGGRFERHLWSLDASSGATNWAAPYEGPSSGGASIGGDLAYAPAISEHGIFMHGNRDGGLYAFDHDGTRRFFYNLPSFYNWTPTLTDDGRLFSWAGGEFIEHKPDIGGAIWMADSPWDNNRRSVDTIAAISGNRAIILGLESMRCYDIDTRTVVWERSRIFVSSPAIADGIVYALVEDRTSGDALETFSLDDGSSLGSYETTELTDRAEQSQPIILEDTVIVPTLSATYIFDRSSRDLIQVLAEAGPVAFTDGFLIISSPEGKVHAYYANRFPRVTGTLSASVKEDEFFSATLDLEEDDGEDLTLKLAFAPSFLSAEVADGVLTLSGTPRAEDVGTHTIRIEVEDEAGLKSDARVFRLEVIFVDDMPTTTGIPAESIPEDSPRKTVNLREFFDDEEDGAAGMQYELSPVAPDLIQNAVIAGGALSFDLTPDAFGDVTFEIRASDTAGQSVISRFELEVSAVPDRPVATPLDPIDAGASAAPASYQLGQHFSDADPGESLQFSIVGNTSPELFSTISIDPGTGELSIKYAPFLSGQSKITIRATDPTGLSIDSELLINLPPIPQPQVGIADEMKLNRQTGLYEHRITVTNSGQRAIGGFSLSVTDLPDEAVAYNASASPSPGIWQVIHAMPVAAGTVVDLILEYHIIGRNPDFTPTITAEHSLPLATLAAPVPDGAGFQIDRIATLADGRLLLEFPSVPNTCYQIQFSADNRSWHNSLSRLRAGGTRVQWIDMGAPRTPAMPSLSGKRFYRVVEKPTLR